MRSVKVDGRKLKQLRARAGMTQERLAKMLGYSDRMIRKMEKGGPISRSARNDLLQFWREYFDSAGIDGRSELNIDLFAPAAGSELEHRARLWFDGVFNERSSRLVDDLVHHDAKLFTLGKGIQGRDNIRQHVHAILAAFGSITLTIDQMQVDSSAAIVFWKAVLEHTGEFWGVSPTRSTIDLQGSSMLQFEKGLIREIREHWNENDFWRKLNR